MNSSHHRIFKYIGFVPNHYVIVINLYVASSFSVFSEFCFVSQLDGIWVKPNGPTYFGPKFGGSGL